MSRRNFLGLAAGTAAGLALAGCGSSGPSNTGGGGGGGGGGPGRGVLASAARVYEIGDGDAGSVGESTVQVSIVVDDSEAGPLTQAASNGNVALVLVPRAG
jgi:hypothetical protein